MKEKRIIEIPLKGDRLLSLCWGKDHLIDLAHGGKKYFFDGSITEGAFNFGYGFDNAIISRSNIYSVVYKTLGTKGVILKNGKIIREINRSFYHADVYEYPATILEKEDGSYLVHCPNEYNKIEIEDIETGESVTKRVVEKADDFFHSRLELSPQNKYLLSAGWIWHPIDFILYFKIEDVFKNPEILDGINNGEGSKGLESLEIHEAVFVNDSNLLISGEQFEQNDSNFIALYSIENETFISKSPIKNKTGKMMSVDDYAVCFFDHPKLIDVATGRVIHEWSNIQCSKKTGSIIFNDSPGPYIAIDKDHRRFAVGEKDKITIIEL